MNWKIKIEMQCGSLNIQHRFSIKAPVKALEISNKYKPKKVIPNNYIFSMLPNGVDEDDLRLLVNEISSTIAYINKNRSYYI